MNFELNIDRYLNDPSWRIDVTDELWVEAKWNRVGDWPMGCPAPSLNWNAKQYDAVTSSKIMFEHGQALIKGATIMKQIEAMAPQIIARFKELEALRKARRKARELTPKPERKTLKIGEARVKALIKKARDEMDDTRDYQTGDRRLWKMSIYIKGADEPTYIVRHNQGRSIDIQMPGGWRYTTTTQRDFIHALARLKPGEVRITGEYTELAESGFWGRDEELANTPIKLPR